VPADGAPLFKLHKGVSVNNRINDKAEILKLVEISRLYYERDLTQAEIAGKMNISRPAVSKLLSEARQRGIVKIDIKSPLMSDENLLEELCSAYGIKGGLVVPAGSADEKLLAKLIISQAALYIETLLPDVTRIGLGWGDTVGRLVDELKIRPAVEIQTGYVCPVIGSAPNDIKWYQTNELARSFAERTGFKPHYLHAPAFPVTLKNKKLFEDTVEFHEISKCWRELEMVILGVGTYPSVPDQATAARFGNLLREKKAAGMLAAYYFDDEGNLIDSKDDIVIRIAPDDLARIDKAFLIGGGLKKISAVRATLKTGLVNHLITDDRTAQALIELV
jgi:DNA-binding transcriptional regulator LsrR (DeoR family)